MGEYIASFGFEEDLKVHLKESGGIIQNWVQLNDDLEFAKLELK